MNEIFDFESVDEFDKHISMTIENYEGLFDLFKTFAETHLTDGGTIVDIGCSTGKFLHSLKKINAEYFGCDVVDIREYFDFNFANGSASHVLGCKENIDVCVSMFTLQFMGNNERKKTIDEMIRLSSEGCIFLIAEKVHMASPVVNAVLQKHLLNRKRQFFNTDEILNKEVGLTGKMFIKPCSIVESELSQIGEVEQIWQSMNFKGWVVYPFSYLG